MQQGEPSQTAKMTAIMRAHHHASAPHPKILNDNIAFALTGLETLEALSQHYRSIVELFASLSDKETAALFVRQTMDFVCMRSRLFEEQLKEAMKEGATQVIVLGAGLDTTAYRFLELLKDVQIYEVDHPDTQMWKKSTLEKSGIILPDNLNFVGIDFETQTLTDALDNAGVRRKAITVMSWLGVIMYLTDESIRASLSVLSEFAPKSRLVLDFIMPDYQQVQGYAPDSLVHLNKVVSQMGEPILSKLSTDELEERLKTAGFSQVNFYSTDDLVHQFIEGRQDLYTIPKGTVTLLASCI